MSSLSAPLPLLYLVRAAVVALFVVAVSVVDRNWPLSAAMERHRPSKKK
jgi:hypothetical protein